MTVEQLQAALTKLETEAVQGLRPELFQFLQLQDELSELLRDEKVKRYVIVLHHLLPPLHESHKDIVLYRQIKLMLQREQNSVPEKDRSPLLVKARDRSITG